VTLRSVVRKLIFFKGPDSRAPYTRACEAALRADARPFHLPSSFGPNAHVRTLLRDRQGRVEPSGVGGFRLRFVLAGTAPGVLAGGRPTGEGGGQVEGGNGERDPSGQILHGGLLDHGAPRGAADVGAQGINPGRSPAVHPERPGRTSPWPSGVRRAELRATLHGRRGDRGGSPSFAGTRRTARSAVERESARRCRHSARNRPKALLRPRLIPPPSTLPPSWPRRWTRCGRAGRMPGWRQRHVRIGWPKARSVTS
jgi:hypothetical protein